MSHFSVAVITKDKNNIENLLEPYSENLEVEPYYDKEYNEMSTYNPNSKWDWYQIGGRWYNTIIVKDNVTDCISNEVSLLCKEEQCKLKGYKYCAGAKIKDIEFDKMIDKEKEYQKAINFWELYVEGRKPKNNVEKEMLKSVLYKKEYFIERYKNKENYAKNQTLFQTYALLTEKGWFSKGDMGWFGMDNSTAESEEKFIELLNKEIQKKENQNKYLIIVDCHI